MVFACGLLAVLSSHGVSELKLNLGAVEGAGWSAKNVEMTLSLPGATGMVFSIQAEGLRLPPPLHPYATLEIRCAQGTVTSTLTACDDASVRLLDAKGLREVSTHGQFHYSEDGFRVTLTPLDLPTGTLAVNAQGTHTRWTINVEATNLALNDVKRWLEPFVTLPVVDIGSGRVSGRIVAQRNDDETQIRLSVNTKKLSFSDEAGEKAGENVSLAFVSTLRRRGKRPWQVEGRAALDSGEIYFHPIYLAAPDAPIEFRFGGRYRPSRGRLGLTSWRFHHPEVLTIFGDGVFDVHPRLSVRRLGLSLERSAFAPIYETYLQSFVLDTALGTMDVFGEISAQVDWRPDGDSSALLTAFDLAVDDADGRFSVFGIGGELHWASRQSMAVSSKLGWDGGQFYRVDVGPSTLVGRFWNRDFVLEKPIESEMLEGSLAVDALDMSGLGTPELEWHFRGDLRPLSMQALSNRLAWLPFEGTLAGVIPSVRYANQTISVEGTLSMQAFDGSIYINNLELQAPFGVIPVLSADIGIENISLDDLTQALSFGNIQGRLEGTIHELVLEDWQPTRFDARLATPEGDDTRHRISQKAVENLASLGGPSAVLSSTFLRFFQQFSYDKLGLSCRLENGVCKMGGVEEGARGYYIVKGGGIPPRIDVFGFNREVDWGTLLERLKAITSTEGPVIR